MKRIIYTLLLCIFVVSFRGINVYAAEKTVSKSTNLCDQTVKELNNKYGLNMELIDYNTNVPISEVIDELEKIAKEQYELKKYIEARKKNNLFKILPKTSTFEASPYKVNIKKGAWGYEDYFEIGCEFYTNGRVITSVESMLVGPIPGKVASFNSDTDEYYYLDHQRTVAVSFYGYARTGITHLGRIQLYAEFYCSDF